MKFFATLKKTLKDKEVLSNFFSTIALYTFPILGHKSEKPFEVYGYHEIEEWVNYGFTLSVLAANCLISFIENYRKEELSYKARVLIGLGTVAGWKAFQAVGRLLFGTEWFEPEEPGDYLSLLYFIPSETGRDLIRATVLTPLTRKLYDIFKRRFSQKG